jgi:hypothetical protein
MSFHANDGLTFERLDDGAVLVELGDHQVVVEESVWASVVASVSQHGETHETWLAARQFHSGQAGGGDPVAANFARFRAKARALERRRRQGDG